jgi:ribosomal-protein-alanine N-acetyltransferase
MEREPVDRFKAFDRFPELTTKRLVLREVTSDDAAWYHEHFSRPEMIHGQGAPPPDGIKGAREELQTYFTDLFENRNGFRWGITLKGNNGIIGSIGFYKWVKPSGHQAEMGYDLDPEFWGKGIMTEAMMSVVDFGFRKMGLNRIEVLIMPRNRRSENLVRKLGFECEGILRQHSFDENGDFCDDVLYSILRSDWMAGRRPQEDV